MTHKSLKNVASSIRIRLLDHARRHGTEYQRVLTRYAIERLLFRLSRTEGAERYVLKGAMLFVVWPEHIFRSTGDLDLLGHGDPDPVAIRTLFTRICEIAVPEDGIVFLPETLKVDPVREADRYQGVQVTLKGELAKALIHVQVDIGFGDHVHPPATRQVFPALLADMPSATMLMYPPETVIAEKFEALIRFGEANGRIKDFHDIWVTSRTFSFDLSNLVDAVRGTLRRRETPIPMTMPPGLDEAFAKIVDERGLWSGFLRRTPPSFPAPLFHDLLADLRAFLTPIIASLGLPTSATRTWDPDSGAWR